MSTMLLQAIRRAIKNCEWANQPLTSEVQDLIQQLIDDGYLVEP